MVVCISAVVTPNHWVAIDCASLISLLFWFKHKKNKKQTSITPHMLQAVSLSVVVGVVFFFGLASLFRIVFNTAHHSTPWANVDLLVFSLSRVCFKTCRHQSTTPPHAHVNLSVLSQVHFVSINKEPIMLGWSCSCSFWFKPI